MTAIFPLSEGMMDLFIPCLFVIRGNKNIILRKKKKKKKNGVTV